MIIQIMHNSQIYEYVVEYWLTAQRPLSLGIRYDIVLSIGALMIILRGGMNMNNDLNSYYGYLHI